MGDARFDLIVDGLVAKGYSREDALRLVDEAVVNVKAKRAYIAPDIFLRVLCGASGPAEVELLRQDKVELVSDLFALYEAIACIEPSDPFDTAALLQIFKKVRFSAMSELASLYAPLSVERKASLRKVAFGGDS